MTKTARTVSFASPSHTDIPHITRKCIKKNRTTKPPLAPRKGAPMTLPSSRMKQGEVDFPPHLDLTCHEEMPDMRSMRLSDKSE